MASLTFTQNIGKTMPHGQAGNYARQPDMIVNTFPVGGSDKIAFGTPLKLSDGKVVAMGASSNSTDFIGIAGREFKSALDYLNQGIGEYAPDEPCSVFQRGSINVKCQRGTPSYGGAVYVRITANSSYSTAVVGGFEASSDTDKSVQLLNCAWQGPADANGIAELRILSLMQPGSYTLPAATSTAIGGVKQGAAVADAASTAPTATEFKALLDSLRAAGVIATSTD